MIKFRTSYYHICVKQADASNKRVVICSDSLMQVVNKWFFSGKNLMEIENQLIRNLKTHIGKYLL